jgi:hypothetical protein
MTASRGTGRLQHSLRRLGLVALPPSVGELCGPQRLDAVTQHHGLFELITALRERGRPARPLRVLRAFQREPVASMGDAQTGSCLHERIMLNCRGIGHPCCSRPRAGSSAYELPVTAMR